MAGNRYFGGSRESSGKGGAASQAMREQLKSGGSIDASENYKKMLKKKLDEAKMKAASGEKSAFGMFGKSAQGPKRSAKATETMKQMALAQQAKEEKKDKKIVIEAKRFHNGNIDKKGRVFDVAGNQVAQVNLKNGYMSTIYGQSLGKYSKGYMTNMALQEAITKNSPFLINQRKLIEQQKQQAATPFGGGSGNDMFGNPMGTDAWGNPPRDIWGNIRGFFGF